VPQIKQLKSEEYYMSETCETVTIVNNAGIKIIMNKSDYDASVHKLYKEPAKRKASK